MAVISLQSAEIEFGGDPVLDKVDLHIADGDHICIIGVNGAGKSTLLKILAGIIKPDRGDVLRSDSLKVAYLPQDVPGDREGTSVDVVCPPGKRDADGRTMLEAERMLKMQGLDPTAEFKSLSGGNRRRVMLAAALLGSPDVVMLDEPTNHLDIESIRWIESNLPKMCGTFVFVTHDRMFLRKMANRIVELDRGKIMDWACDYDTFLVRKEEVLADEKKVWERFDAKLKMEEAWLRQGVKARTHRNQGRLRHLLAMREERAARRTAGGTVNISIQETGRSGSLVLKAVNVSFGYAPDRPVINRLDTVVYRGNRIGVIGPNGCGKTTMIKLLLGDGLSPGTGDIRLGSNLEVVYSDQMRGQLDDKASLADSIAEGREFVMINGVRRHILGYLADFLFSADRAGQKVESLSGGERNRLLMARLFAQPSNVLVLDEPTNDLDLDTLDLLEEQIDAYGGTVIVVSHDRAFLNEVATSSLVFEKFNPETKKWLGPDEGWSVNEYAGGYDDWIAHRPESPVDKPVSKARPKQKVKTKLSYKEKKELEDLPGEIEKLEAEQAEINEKLADPETFKRNAASVPALTSRLGELGSELEAKYARWESLASFEE